MNIYELKEVKENSTHIRVIGDADTAEKVVGDLGIFVNGDGGIVFVTKYANAVILKTEIVNYVEDAK